jgi:hypothetical protein
MHDEGSYRVGVGRNNPVRRRRGGDRYLADAIANSPGAWAAGRASRNGRRLRRAAEDIGAARWNECQSVLLLPRPKTSDEGPLLLSGRRDGDPGCVVQRIWTPRRALDPENRDARLRTVRMAGTSGDGLPAPRRSRCRRGHGWRRTGWRSQSPRSSPSTASRLHCAWRSWRARQSAGPAPPRMAECT